MSDPRDEQDPVARAVIGDAGTAAGAGEVSEHDLREAGLTDEAKQEGLS
ncbi:hypothetical protein QDR37_05730 [Amnibacterium sp. CER49]|nr:hypothetical protein [Amnibacterium sp. CER49]MDH2443441.1 hypothetical protein [Amnibacterium sp. CER49]